MPKIWNSYDFDLEKETACGIDPGLAFRSSLNLPFESNSIWPLPSLTQRVQYQQPPPPPPMVNVSSTSSSSSLQNLHMELPSNQSYYGNYTPIWPAEEKMVGMKRPYPFALDNPPGPSFPSKFPPIVHPLADQMNHFHLAMQAHSISLLPTLISEPKPNSKKIVKENAVSRGDFLTLGPPTTTLTCQNSKLEPPSAYLALHNYGNLDFDSLPYQGSMEDPTVEPGPSVPNDLQPYYSFLPPAIMQIGPPTKTTSNCSGGDAVENVDLNLKL
ncbi:hypothetical protein GH714_010234 [Hevea brasiliensis]|uniref:Uncharacterized protein n=1 Tax=Hevea brasiliensis TaxID=3981 RepID=A0A6A6KBC5_HEVBR|nr:hypothetical protein GH714_010234 [Hevea brasiliensis]